MAYMTAYMTFQVIKVAYNDYNYFKLIINFITKLFRKRTKIDMYSPCKSKL